jgi:DNA-binding NarL/FixJ family response regulator
MTYRVLLVDDHPVVLTGLANSLDAEADIEVVGQARSGPEAVQLTRDLRPDVVVLDYSMGDLDGTPVIGKLIDGHANLGVIIFSVHESVHYVTQAMRAGARGFVVKGDEVDELIEAIRVVGDHGNYITPRLQGDVARQLIGAETKKSGLALLSPREFELVRCRVRGMTLKKAADHLHVSESTASTYQQRTLEKLHLENVAQLIRFALDHGVDG